MIPASNDARHVAVIGAGIAGLSCATRLQQAGLKVSLFDKNRGPAGRMSTRQGDGWQCDHGAQYFTARHPAFRSEVARWQEAGVAGVWAPKLLMIEGDANAGLVSDKEGRGNRFKHGAIHQFRPSRQKNLAISASMDSDSREGILSSLYFHLVTQ